MSYPGMEDMGNVYNISVGKPEGKDNSEDLSVDARKILEWILGKHGRNGFTGVV